MIGCCFSLPVFCICIPCLQFSLQSNANTPFIYVYLLLLFFLWFNSSKLKPNSNCKHSKILQINLEPKLDKSIHFNRINGNEFSVMTNNLLMNDFYTLELTLLVFYFLKRNIYTFSNSKNGIFCGRRRSRSRWIFLYTHAHTTGYG